MRRLIIASSVFAFALAGFATQAHAQDGDDEGEEEEVVVTKRKKRRSDDNVRVIVVEDDDDYDRPRRKRKPRKLTAVPGEAPPEGYHVETTTHKGVWVAGISMFGASYFLSVLSGAIADAAEGHEEGLYSYYGLIPVAGPFVIAGHEEISGPGKIPFILFGAVQAAGMGMFIGGLAAKKEVWIADSASTDPQVYVGLGNIGLVQHF
ncbi:MAG: hypothetical protein HOW73_07590 [Polyangiaceae bacterium]|nr:hypothetical protein [Polyangiaceae bacterium]